MSSWEDFFLTFQLIFILYKTGSENVTYPNRVVAGMKWACQWLAPFLVKNNQQMIVVVFTRNVICRKPHIQNEVC